MPLVTIIIPLFNNEKYLKKCLDSVLYQTYKNIETLIVNDASTDHSLQIAKEYEKNNKNIKIFNNPYNLGLSTSKNIGLEYANGDYVFFLDSNDYLSKNAIQTLVELAIFYNVSLVSAKHQNVLSNSPSSFSKPTKIQNHFINIEKNKSHLYFHCGVVWNKLYHQEIIQNIEFPAGLYYEDNAFIYPLLTKAKKVVQTNEILYFYRRHFKSITIANKLFPSERILDIYSIIDCIEKSCISLNTFSDYKNEILEIQKLLATTPLLNASTWFTMSKEDREQVLANLYQFTLTKFQIQNIIDTPIVQRKIEQNQLYKIRISLMLMQIKQKYFLEENNYSLDQAKKIISKYKR